MARKESKTEKPVKVQKTILAGTSTPTVWNTTPRTRVVVKQQPVEVPNCSSWQVHPRKLSRAIRRVASGVHGSPFMVSDEIKRSCTRYGLAVPTRKTYERTLEVIRERETAAALTAASMGMSTTERGAFNRGNSPALEKHPHLRKETELETLRRLVVAARS